MHRCPFGLIVALAVLASGTAVAQRDEPRFAGGQGSFQPPLVRLDNEALAVNGTGIVALAGPFTLGGGVAGFGWGYGDAPRPRHGFEATVGFVGGGGELDTGDYLPEGYSFGQLAVGMRLVLGGYTHKLRVVDLAEHGRLGVTLYGGAAGGFLDLAITNDAGTAHRGFYALGLLGGGVGQLRLTDWLEVVAFAGGRAMLFAMLEEDGDPLALPSISNLSPEVGGNLLVRLPLGLELSLGSVINFMRRDEEQRDLVKIFTASLGWSSPPPPPPAQEVTQ